MQARTPNRAEARAWERAALLADSGGPGQWRGGQGTETVVRVLQPARVTVRTDRVRLAPPGLAGGQPGRTGGYAVRRRGGRVERLPGKAMNVPLAPGDALIMHTTGGGGVGRAARRSRRRLVEDLLVGAVSRGGARTDYGQVVEHTDLNRARTRTGRATTRRRRA